MSRVMPEEVKAALKEVEEKCGADIANTIRAELDRLNGDIQAYRQQLGIKRNPRAATWDETPSGDFG
jgi:hypothetical protein